VPSRRHHAAPTAVPARGGAITISNSHYNLTFGGADGSLTLVNGLPLTMNYLWYNASTGAARRRVLSLEF
jgi:hypothetical protein